MTTQQIEEGNKLIAEFVGAKVTTPYPFNKDLGYETYHFEYPADKDVPTNYPENRRSHVIDGLKYHSSWDWLMPVVEKIENLTMSGKEEISSGAIEDVDWSFAFEIKDKQCMIHRYCSPQFYGEDSDYLKLYDCRNTNKMKSVYYAVVQFITWYNQNKTSTDK